MAANLILEVCGGEASEVVEAGNSTSKKLEIEFDLSQIKQIIGIEIDKTFVLETLKNLGFDLQKSGQEAGENLLKVQVPSHRSDIKIAQDLIEEIIRIYGLNKITSQPLEVEPGSAIQKSALEIVRNKLVNSGFVETINYSFIDEKSAALFGDIKPELKLQNPIANQMNYMRPNLLIGLLQNVSKNQTRGFNDLSLFEVGRIFSGVKIDQQKNSIAGLRIGKNKQQNHYKDQRSFDVFDVKKDLFDGLEVLGFSAQSFQLTDEAPNYYHQHRSKAVKLGKNIVGYFGELHPLIAKKLDVKNRVNIFELFVEALPVNLNKKTNKKAFSVSDFLPVNRDFAFVLEASTPVGDLLKTVANVDKNLITEVNLFDIYQDQKLGENKKSIAFSIQIQPIEKTLTGEEIEVICQKVIQAIGEKFAGVLRG
jgi:phenylalanyl-tRNA synthetase beta chain